MSVTACSPSLDIKQGGTRIHSTSLHEQQVCQMNICKYRCVLYGSISMLHKCMKLKICYTSTIADARHQEENPMRKKMSEGHNARGSQHMYK